MKFKVTDEADSSYDMPIILEEKDIEDAGIMETSDGTCALMIATETTELCITYAELRNILQQMEELM